MCPTASGPAHMAPAHMASVQIDAPVAFAFDRLCDGAAVGRWALGSMGLAQTGAAGVLCGTSLFDGAESIVRIKAHPDLWLVDYFVGPTAREPRISIRLSPGAAWDMDPATCLAAMTTWRPAGMEAWRWARTCTTHELEVLLFKAQIETDWRTHDAG